MYAKGMPTRQISETIEDIYGFETSESFISNVTDKLFPQIEDLQNRPLDDIYPIIFIDAIHYSVRDNRRLKDILILCADGLTGIMETITAVFSRTEYQRYVVHD